MNTMHKCKIALPCEYLLFSPANVVYKDPVGKSVLLQFCLHNYQYVFVRHKNIGWSPFVYLDALGILNRKVFSQHFSDCKISILMNISSLIRSVLQRWWQWLRWQTNDYADSFRHNEKWSKNMSRFSIKIMLFKSCQATEITLIKMHWNGLLPYPS